VQKWCSAAGAEVRSEERRHHTILLMFIKIVAAMLLASGVAMLTSDVKEPSAQVVAERPNFVFIMADDLDERSMGDLPGIKQVMGSNGTTFENAYVTYSLCCPSRATILRGQYPHNHDIIGNGLPEGGEAKFRNLGRDQSTMATWLNGAGYQTKAIGKYMNSYNNLYIPPGWDEWYVMMGNHWNLSDPTTGKINDDGQETTLGGHSTDIFADKTSDFIRRSHANPEPFFVMIGTKAPHKPPEVADRYQDQFTATPLPRPDNFNELDVMDKPQWVRSLPQLTQGEISNIEDEYRKRLRSMLSVEDLLKETIATLQETEELDNTYIFFTSDNGYHMGNHRLGADKKTPYEEDIGVPLMVRGPGVPTGAVRQQLVLNNDFAPTIAELAGVSTPGFVDGRSFAPLLTGSPPSFWRTAFLEEGWLEGGTVVPTPTHKSVHTQQYMFTEYDTGERELYDLNADPYQLQSKRRVGNEQLYSELQTRLDSLRNCSSTGCRAAEWDTRVTSTLPKADATAVAPTTNIKATFSEDRLGSSINGQTFKLFEKGSTTKIAAAISYSASTDTATLDPTNSLRRGITYKAVVTTGAKDVAGNPLDQNPTILGLQQKTWSFTTSP
jgi:N-acetylglucosamine-6-sulfatase